MASSVFVTGSATWSTGLLQYLGIGTIAPTAHLQVSGFTLGGASATDNIARFAGTLATVNTATARGVRINITSAGSSAQDQEALEVELIAGYTGASMASALAVNNFAASTGTGAWTISAGNFGARLNARGTTAGHNTGSAANAQGSSVLNMGGMFRAVNSSNTPAVNMGGAAKAASGTVNVGFFAGLSDAVPTFAASAALIADNMAVASSIFLARDNGTTTFEIADGGPVTSTSSIKSTSATAGIGYGAGAGGTVTQLTSKATGVTLSTITGEITLHNATLNAATIVAFTLTNTAIAATDHVVVDHVSAGTLGAYTVTATPAAGSASIAVRNNTAGNLSEAIVLKVTVIKAVTA